MEKMTPKKRVQRYLRMAPHILNHLGLPFPVSMLKKQHGKRNLCDSYLCNDDKFISVFLFWVKHTWQFLSVAWRIYTWNVFCNKSEIIIEGAVVCLNTRDYSCMYNIKVYVCQRTVFLDLHLTQNKSISASCFSNSCVFVCACECVCNSSHLLLPPSQSIFRLLSSP